MIVKWVKLISYRFGITYPLFSHTKLLDYSEIYGALDENVYLDPSQDYQGFTRSSLSFQEEVSLWPQVGLP